MHQATELFPLKVNLSRHLIHCYQPSNARQIIVERALPHQFNCEKSINIILSFFPCSVAKHFTSSFK